MRLIIAGNNCSMNNYLFYQTLILSISMLLPLIISKAYNHFNKNLMKCSLSPQRQLALICVKVYIALINKMKIYSVIVNHYGHALSYSIMQALYLIIVIQFHPILLLSRYLHTHKCGRYKDILLMTISIF